MHIFRIIRIHLWQLELFKAYLEEAAAFPDVVEISVSTRPDCIRTDYLACLAELQERTHVGINIELGLQTANYHTLDRVHRGHGLAEYIAEKYGKDMATMLFPNQTPFYVVTNKSEYRGASAILNKKMLSEFGRKYNINKVVVIPSSIHEMLILSADILELERMEELTKMVQDVNANEVLVKEQLSDRAYIFGYLIE